MSSPLRPLRITDRRGTGDPACTADQSRYRALASGGLLGCSHPRLRLPVLIVFTARRPDITPRTRATAALRGIGGLFVLRRLVGPRQAASRMTTETP